MLIVIHGINQRVYLLPRKDNGKLAVALHFRYFFGIPHIAQSVFKKEPDRCRVNVDRGRLFGFIILHMENELPYISVSDGHGILASEFQEPFRKTVIIIACVLGKVFEPQVFLQPEKIFFVHENALHNVRF